MDIASLCPLPVGLVPWASPEPTTTVVIKATFALDRDGEAALAEEQEPLCGDRASSIDPEELDSASDFAPLKARADVLLVGHAFAEQPTTAIPALFRVDALTRRFFALAGAPATEIPLASPYLRAAFAESEERVRVGPIAPWSRERARILGERALGADGLPLGPLHRGFDFGYFNAAPAEQQVELLRVGATLLLRGLLPGVERRELRLPGLRPVVFLMRRATNGRGSTDEVALRCDTLVVDTDRALCTLTWRGVFEPPGDDEASCLLVDIARHGERPTFRDLHRKLSRAAERGRAPEHDDASSASPAPRESDAQTIETLDELEVRDAEEEDEPTGRHLAVPDPAALRGMGFRLGTPLGTAPIRASEVDPFELQPNRELPEPPTAQVIEETIRVHKRALDATFELGEHEAAEPPRTAPLPTPQLHARHGTLGGDDAPRGAEVLPFRPAAPPIAPPVLLERAREEAPRGAVLHEALLHEEAPRPRPSLDASRGMSLELYARIKVALWEGAAPRADVLAGFGLDEIGWALEERRRAEELAADARAGKQDRVLAFHAALKAAGEAQVGETMELPVDRYVALRVALEESAEPERELEAEAISAAAFRRIHRAMTRRSLADPSFDAALRRALVEARRSR